MWKPRRLTTLWAFTACYKEEEKEDDLDVSRHVRMEEVSPLRLTAGTCYANGCHNLERFE
jgi:hypothetical protein